LQYFCSFFLIKICIDPALNNIQAFFFGRYFILLFGGIKKISSLYIKINPLLETKKKPCYSDNFRIKELRPPFIFQAYNIWRLQGRLK